MEEVVGLEDNDRSAPPALEKGPVKMTPLPYFPLFVLCCIVLSESFSITMIFPFLADMVLDFGLTTDEGEIGFYAGWIAASFNIAQFSSSFAWGKLSDMIGRRPVLLIGLAGNLLMIFLFGWSKELWFALLARSLNGFLNGNIGVVKTYLGEITDNTNSAKGFSIFGLCWGVGLIIGPSIGGFLSKPGVKAPHLFPPGTLLAQFPYLLPCLVSCFVTFVGLVLGIFYLKETLPIKRDRHAEEGPLIPKSSESKLDIVEDEVEEKCYNKFLCFRFFGDKDVALTSSLYSLLCFYKMMTDEVFAIWAPLSKERGGIEFSSNDIGLVYAISGAAALLSQFFLFPIFIKKIGGLLLYKISSLFCFILLCVQPFSNLVVPYGVWAVWTYMGILFVLFAVSNNFLFISVMLLVNNSAPRRILGSVNGFAQTWASLLRSFAPALAGSVLGWSLTSSMPDPINFSFTFFFIAFFPLVSFGLTFLLDPSINHRKE